MQLYMCALLCLHLLLLQYFVRLRFLVIRCDLFSNNRVSCNYKPLPYGSATDNCWFTPDLLPLAFRHCQKSNPICDYFIHLFRLNSREISYRMPETSFDIYLLYILWWFLSALDFIYSGDFLSVWRRNKKKNKWKKNDCIKNVQKNKKCNEIWNEWKKCNLRNNFLLLFCCGWCFQW